MSWVWGLAHTLYNVFIIEHLLHTIKLNKPVSMVETDHAGFQVSGWKSLIDRHSLETINQSINQSIKIINKSKNYNNN